MWKSGASVPRQGLQRERGLAPVDALGDAATEDDHGG